MTVLAYGAEKVRALEFALGGKPPKEATKHVAAELNRHVQEQFERRKAHLAKVNSLLKRQRTPLLNILKADKRTAEDIKEARELFRKGPIKPHARPPREKIEPRMVTGSSFWLKVPPYDDQQGSFSGDASASEDALNGTYNLSMSGNGSSSNAWAGLAINFFATEDDPSQRFAALVEYDYDWYDYSNLAPAHNDAGTNIWIWGFTENRWVLQQGGFFPSWSDGTGWWDSHGSGGDGSEQFGNEALEAFFPAFGNNWYQAWVWSWGSCDDISDFDYWSVAGQAQAMTIPFVVFGSL